MIILKEFDKIKLKNGKIGVIMEVYNDNEFLVEFALDVDEWDLDTVKRDDIVAILKEKIINIDEEV